MVFGGLDADGMPIPEIVGTEIDEHGVLGAWRKIGMMPEGLSALCVAASGQYVYLVGGLRDAKEPVADVWLSAVEATGELRGWPRLASIPTPRAHLGCAVR